MMTNEKSLEQQIMETTEARPTNGVCGYGEWRTLVEIDEDNPVAAGAIADEVAERWFSGMRQEDVDDDESGEVMVGGQGWEWRR